MYVLYTYNCCSEVQNGLPHDRNRNIIFPGIFEISLRFLLNSEFYSVQNPQFWGMVHHESWWTKQNESSKYTRENVILIHGIEEVVLARFGLNFSPFFQSTTSGPLHRCSLSSPRTVVLVESLHWIAFEMHSTFCFVENFILHWWNFVKYNCITQIS